MTNESKESSPAAGGYGSSDHYDAQYYAWQSVGIGVQATFRLRHFLPHVKPSDTVLDFGCAGGAVLGGLDVARRIGVELNDLPRAAAKNDYGIEVYKFISDVPDGIADVLISSHTLEHVEAPVEALRQLRGKLKVDGVLILVLPIDDWRSQREWYPDDINRHLHTWTPLLLGNTLDEAGFVPMGFEISRQTLMRGADRLMAMPAPVFQIATGLVSRLRHRQELVATARPRG